MQDNIIVGQSKFGKGIFATKDFMKGELVFELQGSIINFAETLVLGNEECYPVQIDIDKYIYLIAPYKYINHSCSPNCGIQNQSKLIAIKKIKKGEELLFDYSTTMLERSWTMNCECDSKNCRKKITDFDLLPANIQQKYIKLGIVPDYCLKANPL
jgi:hypothetical protein